MKTPYGMRSVCKHCEQDIEYNGNRQWLDRGGNRGCVAVFDKKKQEYVTPNKSTQARFIMPGSMKIRAENCTMLV